MNGQEQISQDDAARYLESDAYTKLPQAQKDRVIDYLKKNMQRGTPPVPSASEGVAERRGVSPLGSVIETPQKSVTGRVLTGAARGAGNIVDIPGAVVHAAKDEPTEYEKGRHERHPFVFAKPERGLGLTLDRLFFDPQFEQGVKAKKSFQEGKVSEGLGHGGAALLPMVGPMAGQTGEQVGKGEWAESLGENAVYALTGLLTKKMLPKGVQPWQRLSAAAGGGVKDFEATMGDLARTARDTGFRRIKNPTVEDLRNLVRETGKRAETDFNLALQPIAGEHIVPSNVARDLMKEADKFDRNTPEGRAARQYLRKRAVDYQQPWSLGDLNQKRMKMFDSVLEAKTDVKQMGAVRGNVETLADKTIEKSLRDIVYDTMEKRYKGKVDFRELKGKQARLLDLNDRLQKRTEQIAEKEAEYRAAGPLKRAGLYVRGHLTGISPAVHPKLEGAPEKAASKQIKKAFSRVRNPTAAKPIERHKLPPLEPLEGKPSPTPQTPVKPKPSAITGHSRQSVTGGTSEELKQAKASLRQRLQESGWNPEKESLSAWAERTGHEADVIEAHRLGVSLEYPQDVLYNRGQNLKAIQEAKKAAKQGGHAGGGVSSVEELSRPGHNYVIGKSGDVTFHGKSFAPEGTRAGSVHVTVKPDGSYIVNNGTLTPVQEQALKKLIAESKPKRRLPPLR